MGSAKFTTPGLLKIKVFWNKGYGLAIFVHDFINNTLLRDATILQIW